MVESFRRNVGVQYITKKQARRKRVTPVAEKITVFFASSLDDFHFILFYFILFYLFILFCFVLFCSVSFFFFFSFFSDGKINFEKYKQFSEKTD